MIQKFKSEVDEGLTYVFENFMIARNDRSYKDTEHKYKFNFMHSINVFKILTTYMSDCHFDFMFFPLILTASREDKLLGKYYLFLIHMNTHTHIYGYNFDLLFNIYLN